MTDSDYDYNSLLQLIGVAVVIGICLWYAVRWFLNRRKSGADDCDDYGGCEGCGLIDHCRQNKDRKKRR